MKFLAAFLAASALLLAQSPLRLLSDRFEALVEKTDPAVVQVYVRSLTTSDQESRPVLKSEKGNGSGAIVSSDGYIVTNAHVVANARRVQVLLAQSAKSPSATHSILKPSGKVVDAVIVGQDRETDVAVLKIEETNLPHLEFGDSEALKKGELVFAFGSPLGLDNSVTMGVVSSVARQVRPEDPMIYIQTDASINPGNSGGPLVSAEGKLIGLNTFILSQSGGFEGIGFAAPANIVRSVFEQIRQQGRVRRGQIGVASVTLSPALARALKLGRDTGVLIEDVAPSSSAQAAGLQIGDIVLSLNGKAIENSRQLGVNIYQNAGKTIELEVLRGQEGATETKKIGVAVLERPGDPDRLLSLLGGEESRVRKLGILAVDLDDKTIPLFGQLREYTGAVVAGVTSDLSLDHNGLQPGDVIHRLNETRVTNLEQLRSIVKDLRHSEVVALQIERMGRLSYLMVEID